MGTLVQRARVRAVVWVALAALLVSGGAALAAHTDGATYTGCLATTGGTLSSVREGTTPIKPCGPGSLQVQFGSGDITSIIAGTGLSGGGTAGSVTLVLADSYRLPQDCASGQIAQWGGAGWTCGTDSDTQYTAGTGLTLSGSQFSVAPGYRVQNGPDCPTGQFVTGFDAAGVPQCGAGAAAAVAYSARTTASFVNLGPSTFQDPPVTEVVSLNLPAGSYLLVAAITAVNADDDDGSFVTCAIPGDTAITGSLAEEVDPGEVENLAMTSAISHAGGAVKVMCSRNSFENDNTRAWGKLSAIRVGSLG